MNRHVLIGLISLVIFGGGTAAGAKEVNLATGEIYRQEDLTVTCGQSSPDVPLAINDCQYWDDFNKKCLFEKTTFRYKHLECVEECQYWDTFNNTCHYRTTCTFYPPNKVFVQTTCKKFDSLNNTCEKTKNSVIEP